jgi:hypothetical protein
MKDKHNSFEFNKVGVEEVKHILLRLVAEYIVTPV